jgi:glycosyltransferase involved in cell wall biosynthesis
MPTLSLCMIVKDEEASLPRCLDSVAGVVDELIVVDTGSRDRTIEIARSHGAKVIEQAWTDDFSAARNTSLDHATGDWLLYLDADEELMAEDRQALRDLLADQVHEGLFVYEINFSGDRLGFDQVTHSTLRLFRNRPEYRFEGAIHEQIMPAILRRGGQVAYSQVRLRHYGYLRSAIVEQGKVERNLRIARAEVKRKPNSAFALYNLAMEYLRLGDFAEALEYNRKAFLHLSDLTVQYSSRLLRNLVACLTGLKRYDEALKVLKDAVLAYPDFTDLFYQRGLIYLETGENVKAMETFRTCLEKGEAPRNHISDRGVGTYRAWYGLGTALERLGDYRGALEAYEHSVKAGEVLSGAVHRVALILLQVAGPEAVQARLAQLVDLTDSAALVGLAIAFRDGGQWPLAFRYLEQALQVGVESLAPLKGEILLHLGRYDEAAAELAVAATKEVAQASLASLAGLAALFAGEPERAEALFAAAAERDRAEKGRVLAYRLFGRLRSGLVPERWPEVTADHRKAYADAAKSLLGFLLERQEFEAFEAGLSLLEPLRLTESARHLFLGKLYHAFGFHESAIEELRALPPKELDAEAAEVTGRLCERQGLIEEALTFYHLAIQREPANAKWYLLLAGKAQQFAQPQLAEEVAEQGLRRFPGHIGLRNLIAPQNASTREEGTA